MSRTITIDRQAAGCAWLAIEVLLRLHPETLSMYSAQVHADTIRLALRGETQEKAA